MKNIEFNLCDVEELKKCSENLTRLQDNIIMLVTDVIEPEDIEMKDLGYITDAKLIINEFIRSMENAEAKK
jgi:hypothetical protein